MKKFFAILLCLAFCFPAALAEESAAFPDFTDAYPGMFFTESDTPTITDTSYISGDIRIEISVQRISRSDVYVADIYLRTPEAFQRAFGGGKWKNKMQSVKTIATDSAAILALTGDNSHNFSSGFVVANGDLKRKSANSKRDLCVLYKSGEMVTIPAKEIDIKALIADADKIWQTFLFGPALLAEDGSAKEKFTSSVGAANPRAAIGYYAPGHYCFVQVDGRGTKSQTTSSKNVGMTLKELSALMAELGCKAAYNLDGGQSALLWFNGKVISTPYNGGRNIGDAVIIKVPGGE